MNKLASGLVALSFLASPLMASANTASTSTNVQIQAMLTQIQSLQAQIQTLKVAQAQVQTAGTNVMTTLGLLRGLRQGMSGEDVKALQAILAADATIYPEGIVSGFYGRLTSEAVKKFQKKHGFETVGFVGPKTLKKLNELVRDLGLSEEDDDEDDDNDNDRKEKKLCAKVPPGHLIAKGWLKKNDRPIVPECQKLPKGIKDKIGGGNGTTTTDTILPIISSIVSVPSANNSTIYWTTNENSTTKVYYGTTSGVDTSATSTLSVSNGSLVLNHGITITGLTGGTLYYYVVESKDSAGNTTTSGVNSFTTTIVADTTPPLISGVGTMNLLGTTTSITWTTNESSNSKVWFGTTTPITSNLSHSSVNMTSNGSLVTSHSMPLTGLSTTTTYYFVVVSSDSAGNTATSTEGSFVTTVGL